MTTPMRHVKLPLSADAGEGQPVSVLVPVRLADLLEAAASVTIPRSRQQAVDIALGGSQEMSVEVSFFLPQGGRAVEAVVSRRGDGLEVEYREPYMRQRDPEGLLEAGEGAKGHRALADRFGVDIDVLAPDILATLTGQDLVVVPVLGGGASKGPALAVLPLCAAFVAVSLWEHGGRRAASVLGGAAWPRVQDVVYIAPVLRHTLCAGRQIIVHERRDDCYEVYALHLPPGPIAGQRDAGLDLSDFLPARTALQPHVVRRHARVRHTRLVAEAPRRPAALRQLGH